MNFDALNSLTKYPSIPTLHKMGDKGKLSNELTAPLPNEPLIFSEKINGANGRIIISPEEDYFIGSREELLWAKGDRIINPALGIVNALKVTVDKIYKARTWYHPQWTVIYSEVFGGRVNQESKNYSKSSVIGARVFDVAYFDDSFVKQMFAKPLPEIASWRDNADRALSVAGGMGGFLPTNLLEEFVLKYGLPCVPYIHDIPQPPVDSIKETYEWLKETSFFTLASLNNEPIDLVTGLSEGVVGRTVDRKYIVKIRHEDYSRTIRAMNQQGVK